MEGKFECQQSFTFATKILGAVLVYGYRHIYFFDAQLTRPINRTTWNIVHDVRP